MITFPILTLMTFLPLIGAGFMLVIGGKKEEAERNVKLLALWVSGAVFILSLFLLYAFDGTSAAFQFMEHLEWFPPLGLTYAMGVDGISVFFVVLSAFLTPICVLASWESIKTRVKEYMIAFMVLESFMIGTFCALDLVLFYVFFEAVLIPMYLIIGIWGGPRRVYAAFKFFLFTLLGSVLMLVGMMALYWQAGTTDITQLITMPPPYVWQLWIWMAFFASFAVKMPMWPVHTWLPDAHVEAPTAGSVILAGVLLKMGGYGFLRFSLPMLPEASAEFADMVYWLSIIAIIYTSLVALVQEDMKKLIAYSSVAHMGFVTLGIFTATVEGVAGGIFQMISHGVISAALFLCVGVVYDRLHTRDIKRYGGLVQLMPRYATIFMILVLGSVGLPGTSGFVGEFLSLLAAFKVDPVVAAFSATGVVLGAAYMLLLYRRVIFGEHVHEEADKLPDVTPREFWIFMPLVALVLLLGVSPNLVLKPIEPSVQKLISNYERQMGPKVKPMPQTASAADIAGISPAAGDDEFAPVLTNYHFEIVQMPQPRQNAGEGKSFND